MASQKSWGKTISDESVDIILYLTECHPYYLNRLCRMLWDADSPTNADIVEDVWLKYVEVQKVDWISEMISRLTVNQRAVMAGISQLPENEPRGKDFTNKLEMSSSSVQRTINTLLQKDLIYRDLDGFYNILNPTIKTVFSRNKYFGL